MIVMNLVTPKLQLRSSFFNQPTIPKNVLATVYAIDLK